VRILYVWDAEYPWDVRTEKLCLAMVKAGHDVIITGRNLQGRSPTEQLPEGLVERLPAWLGRAGSFPAFFNPFWIVHLRRLVRRHRIDLLIVRDLPLGPTALLAAGHRPVIMDMAENYPAMIGDVWTDRRQRPLDLLIRNPSLVAGIERFTVHRLDHILVVVEESGERLVGLGVPKDRISVVSNTPPAARVSGALPAGGGPLQVIYLGLMEHHRGLGCTLEARAILKRNQVPVHLHLVGDGRDYEEFRRYAESLGLGPDEVSFHGRLPHPEAIAVVSRCQVGLVPHEARESWNTTIPNKLFDYMAAGLAVITSDAAPAARVVLESGAGLVFESGNGQSLAAQIQACLDPETRQRFGKAGQDAIRSKYNWEADSRVLLRVLEHYASRRAGNGN
jgi:glycosyltransferase involved in cell wall biosynthesis